MIKYSLQIPKKEEPKKQESNDDDDWSDFVSNTEPAKTLQLSVLNLNQIQPTRPPVPLITPQGLMQTKIPAGTFIPPLLQTGIAQSKSSPSHSSDGYRPSIISNQFSEEFLGSDYVCGGGGNFLPTAAPPLKQQTNDDDDDWTDFISVQPVAQHTPNQSSNSFLPNIITNPAHGYGVNGEMGNYKFKAPAQSGGRNKNAIASISSMPDLDFVFSSKSGRTYGGGGKK